MRRRIELFHGTDFSVPYLPLRPSVMTLHDLSPWLDPLAARCRPHPPPHAAPTAGRPGDHGHHAQRSRAPRRHRAIPSPGRPRGRDAARGVRTFSTRSRALRPRRRIFCSSARSSRARISTRLIEAWREVRKTRAVDLVLAGRTRADFPPLSPRAGPAGAGRRRRRGTPVALFGALAVVYPSLYEGFGLPVLEAMQCGAVVITSRDPAILELSGGAAVHVDATDTRSLGDALAVAHDRPRISPLCASARSRGRANFPGSAPRSDPGGV